MCVCVCVYIYIYCVCVCIYIYIHTHTKFKIKLSQEQLKRKDPEINYDWEKHYQFCGKKRYSCPCTLHEGVERSVGTAPRTLDLATIRRLAFSFKLWPFYT